MYTPSTMSHALLRVNEEQAIRATRFTWQRAPSQRRPGRWVANWFHRFLPTMDRRRGQSVPVDVLANSGHGSGPLPMTVEPSVRTPVGVALDESMVASSAYRIDAHGPHRSD